MANESEHRVAMTSDTKTDFHPANIENHQENLQGETTNRIEEDSWWRDIENVDLEMDPVPNVSADFNSQTDDEQNELTTDFDRLHRIADKIKLTLREHVKNMNTSESSSSSNETANEGLDVLANKAEQHNQSLEEFKEELRLKRLERQTALQELRDEITFLRQQLKRERNLTQRLRNGEQVEELCDTEKHPEQIDKRCSEAESTIVSCDNESSDIDNDNVDTDDEDPLSRSRHANIELANAQLALQMANSENISLRSELAGVQKQVSTLKEVINCCKQMLVVKEEQCSELKNKLCEIEKTLPEYEMQIMSDKLRNEYERQLVNIRQLRQLYEERQRIAAAEHENVQRLLAIKRDELTAEKEKTKTLEESKDHLTKDLELSNNELECLRDACKEYRFEQSNLKEQLDAINALFGQMIIGFGGKNNVDIDRLTILLEENRSLLKQMATEEISCYDTAVLIKLLLELIEKANADKNHNKIKKKQYIEDDCNELITTDQSEEEEAAACLAVANEMKVEEVCLEEEPWKNMSNKEQLVQPTEIIATERIASTCKQVEQLENTKTESCPNSDTPNEKPNEISYQEASQSATEARFLKLNDVDLMNNYSSTNEIIANLPKVWRVVMEILNHYKLSANEFIDNVNNNVVGTANRASPVKDAKANLSVSETYLKLMDLIVEKKSLVKETNHLKTLNHYLENRLNDQKQRLGTVSGELTRTWHLVSKMQRQHRQFHTQEQILRYQLQQKRRLLSELKDELEYCRRKWATARAKNAESQEQCNDLRREFAKRKLEDYNNSAESGYSDSGGPELSDDDSVDTQLEELRQKRLKEIYASIRHIKYAGSTSVNNRTEIAGKSVMDGRSSSAPPACNYHNHKIKKLSTPNSHSCDSLNPTVNENLKRSEESIETVEKPSGSSHLEQQYKYLLRKTSDSCERLQMKLENLQKEIPAAEHSTSMQNILEKTSDLERMIRASSLPGCLTAREEEYTRKRSERLHRLEKESRELISRIKRTSDRGHYLRCSVDRLRRVSSPENNFERKSEKSINPNDNYQLSPITECSANAKTLANSCLGIDDKSDGGDNEAINLSNRTCSIEKRIAELDLIALQREKRLEILEEEGKQLITKLSETSKRGTNLINRITQRVDNKQRTSILNEPLEESLNLTEDTDNLTTMPDPTPASSSGACVTSGAIPKTSVQLNYAKPKSSRLNSRTSDKANKETLAEMVTRLKSLPFPTIEQSKDPDEKDEIKDDHNQNK